MTRLLIFLFYFIGDFSSFIAKVISGSNSSATTVQCVSAGCNVTPEGGVILKTIDNGQHKLYNTGTGQEVLPLFLSPVSMACCCLLLDTVFSQRVAVCRPGP